MKSMGIERHHEGGGPFRDAAAPIDAPIELVPSPSYWARMGCVIALFVVMGLFLLWNIGARVIARPSPLGALLLGFAVLIVCVPLYFPWKRRIWVQRFTPQGIELRSGRHFRWSELRAVRRVMSVRRFGRAFPSYYVLLFTSGTGEVYPEVLRSSPEASVLLERLATQMPPTGAR